MRTFGVSHSGGHKCSEDRAKKVPHASQSATQEKIAAAVPACSQHSSGHERRGRAGYRTGAGHPASHIDRATLQETNQKTPEVSTEELRQILAAKRAVVFDARPYQEYAVSHIPGALNVAAKPGMPKTGTVAMEGGSEIRPRSCHQPPRKQQIKA
jgi:hypothetical protein